MATGMTSHGGEDGNAPAASNFGKNERRKGKGKSFRHFKQSRRKKDQVRAKRKPRA